MNISSTLNFVSTSFLSLALLLQVGQMKAYDDPAASFNLNNTGSSGSSFMAQSVSLFPSLFRRAGAPSTPPAPASGGWFSSWSSATPPSSAQPTASSNWSLPSVPSWFRSSSTSGSTAGASSTSPISSFTPSTTQLAIAAGATGAAAVSLATYYVYKKLNDRYTKAFKDYQHIRGLLEEYLGTDTKPTNQNVSTKDRAIFLSLITTGTLAQFKKKLSDDIASLSLVGSWAALGMPYAQAMIPSKVKTLRSDLQDILHYVESLIANGIELPTAITQQSQQTNTPVTPQQSQARPSPNVTPAAPAQTQTWEKFNRLIVQKDPDFTVAPAKKTIPWSTYTSSINQAIDQAQQTYGNIGRLVYEINNFPEAFALFIENATKDNSFIALARKRPDLVAQTLTQIQDEKLREFIMQKLPQDIAQLLNETQQKQNAEQLERLKSELPRQNLSQNDIAPKTHVYLEQDQVPLAGQAESGQVDLLKWFKN